MPDRGRLQARRDRDQALRAAAAAHAADPPRHRRRGDRPLHPAEIALWGDARAGLEDLAAALSDGARGRPRGASRLCRRDRAAHGEMGGRRRAAAQFARPADHMARLMRRAERDPAGRRDPGRRRRLRRPLGRAAVRHQASGPAFHRRPRLRLDRLRPARRHRRAAGRARPAGRRAHRRRRLQHDARRTGNRAPHRLRSAVSSSTTPPPATSRRCSTRCWAGTTSRPT